MRLAFLYRRFAHGGGTEADLYRTAGALAERGHEVHLFCAAIRAAAPPGVTVERVPIVRAGRVARLLSFAWAAPRQAARRGPWDVVIGFGRTPRQDLIRCGGGTHRSYLETMRRFGARRPGLGAYHRAVLWLETLQFRPTNYRRVLAVSQRVGDEIRTGYAVAPGRIRVLYNGVDLERFEPARCAGLRVGARRRLGIAEEAAVVLAVGSGFRRKGIDGLLGLWREKPPADARLVVVGDDERLAAYRRMAREGALSDSVRFVGPQTAIEDFYAAADVVVVASLQEAFGNVVLEALACGRPVVTSAQVGAAELLNGALRDFVIDRPDDVAALRERLVAALGPGRVERARLARQAAETHPWSAHFTELERLLGETVACGRG